MSTPDLRHHTFSMLEISTAHIRRETAAQLDEAMKAQSGLLWEELAFSGHSDSMGYVFYCSDENATAAREAALPELAALIDLCNQERIDRLCLDRDGSVVAEIPYFEWDTDLVRNAEPVGEADSAERPRAS